MEIKEIENLAKLCRIELSDNEKKELLGEMDSILDFVNQIQKVVVSPATRRGGGKESIGQLKNIMRNDESPHESGQYTDAILAMAPKTEEGYFKVKKIL